MFETINGLPAHPLFIHAPVVLVPLSALFALVLTLRPNLRRKAGWAVALSAVVALITTQVAITSGYRFDELLEGAVNTDRHASLATTSRNLVVLFVVAAACSAVLDRRSGDSVSPKSENLSRIAMAAATVFSTAATVWMVRTGEEGARLVWSGVVS